MGNIDESMGTNSTAEINQAINQTAGKKLWNPKWFVVISVLFSFLPVAILYSLNYGRLGLRKKRNISLVISFTAFTVMVLILSFINHGVMKYIVYGINIGAAVYMNQKQSKLFNNHIEDGGRKASYLVPVLVSIVFTAISLFLYIYISNVPDQVLMFNKNELYYTENIQKSEAEKLGAYLGEKGFFNENERASVKLDKEDSTYKFSIIIDSSKLDDKYLEQSVKIFCEDLSKNVFNNSKVDIIYCNNVFKPLKTISN